MSERGVLSILLIGMRFPGSEVSREGGGAFLKKGSKNLSHILGRGNWFSELSQITNKTLF